MNKPKPTAARRARLRRLLDAEKVKRAAPELAKADARSRAKVQALAVRRCLLEQVQEALDAGEPVSEETLRVLHGTGQKAKKKRAGTTI